MNRGINSHSSLSPAILQGAVSFVSSHIPEIGKHTHTSDEKMYSFVNECTQRFPLSPEEFENHTFFSKEDVERLYGKSLIKAIRFHSHLAFNAIKGYTDTIKNNINLPDNVEGFLKEVHSIRSTKQLFVNRAKTVLVQLDTQYRIIEKTNNKIISDTTLSQDTVEADTDDALTITSGINKDQDELIRLSKQLKKEVGQ